MLGPDVLGDIDQHVRAGMWDADTIIQSVVVEHAEALGIPVEDGYLRVDLAVEPIGAVLEAVETAVRRNDAVLAQRSGRSADQRLREAFAVLEGQGIATLVNAGMTDQIARPEMWRRVVALERLGCGPSGFCYLHEQDIWGAMQGDGLYLRFGASPVDDDDSVDNQNVQAVGRRIVDALASCGLTGQWNGHHTQAILLPDFDWRRTFSPDHGVRGLRAPGEMDVEPLIAAAMVEIQAGSNLGDVDFGERFHDYYGAAGLGRDLSTQHETFVSTIQAFVEDERRAEAGWAAPTDNDRLVAALDSLAASGVLASNAGTTLDDAWAYAGLATTPAHRGAILYSMQDVLWCLRGEGLYLAFGAWRDGAIDVRASVELARQLCDSLDRAGLEASWDGSYAHRVHLPAFRWQKRRWTPSPRVSSAPQTQLFAGARSPEPTGEDFLPDLAAATRSHVIERHLALRDAGAFDLQLAHRMREKGTALGIARAHAASFGKPLCHLRAGEIAWFMPRSGTENLPAPLIGPLHRGLVSEV